MFKEYSLGFSLCIIKLMKHQKTNQIENVITYKVIITFVFEYIEKFLPIDLQLNIFAINYFKINYRYIKQNIAERY